MSLDYAALLRQMMEKWREAIRNQNEIANLWIAALARRDFDQTVAFAALLTMNSGHQDDIQKAVQLLLEDPDFTFDPDAFDHS